MTNDVKGVLDVRSLQVSVARDQHIMVNFTLRPGEVAQLCGPSGCGKTTVMRALARLEKPRSGEMSLSEQPSREIGPGVWRRQVAYLSQHPVMFEGTVQQNLAAGFATSLAQGAPYDPERAREMLCELRLDPATLMPQDARTLSGGEAARVALCRTLLIEPAVLLADEPTTAMDPDGAAAVVRLLRRRIEGGGAMVLVTHDSGPWRGVDRQEIPLTPEAP